MGRPSSEGPIDSCRTPTRTNCNNCVVRVLSSFCGELNQQEIDLFIKMKRTHIYEKADTVFYEGHSSVGIYILCSGSVKLVQSSKKGKQQILSIASPGDLIEKNHLFHGGRHSTTAQALERSEVSFFYREEFLDGLKSNNHLAVSVIKALGQEIEQARDRNRQLLFESARERLAATLIDLGHRFGRQDQNTTAIDLGLKRDELAEMIGVTLETVVRLLSDFNKERLIRLAGKTIIILDEEGLRKVKG